MRVCIRNGEETHTRVEISLWTVWHGEYLSDWFLSLLEHGESAKLGIDQSEGG